MGPNNRRSKLVTLSRNFQAKDNVANETWMQVARLCGWGERLEPPKYKIACDKDEFLGAPLPAIKPLPHHHDLNLNFSRQRIRAQPTGNTSPQWAQEFC